MEGGLKLGVCSGVVWFGCGLGWDEVWRGGKVGADARHACGRQKDAPGLKWNALKCKLPANLTPVRRGLGHLIA